MRVDEHTFFVGTYTQGKSEGIYICRMDTSSGAMELKGVRAGVENPSYLTIAHNNRFLYSVNELSGKDESHKGTVSAFRIDDHTDGLAFLNKQGSQGSTPCHVTIDRYDRYVLVSNYGSGSVVVLPVMGDGSLGGAVEMVQHKGSGLDSVRQRTPHAHSTVLDASNHFVFVPDLGLDKILIYRFDEKLGSLRPPDRPSVQAAAGAGPRHFVFDAGGKRAYATNELNSTLTAFDYDVAKGDLRVRQSISTLPGDFRGDNICADVQVHPSGKFVFASNRGHDSIASFVVEKERGKLEVVQYQSSLGKTPRAIIIDPTGRFLLAANQDSDTVVVFTIDVETGRLSPTGHTLAIPTPACLRFLSRAS
jgi:6-phosphogluconolactonase